MFAVIRSGGKQYSVKSGDVLKVQKLDAEQSSVVCISDVLAVSDGSGGIKVGTPVVSGASVSAEVLRHLRDKKVIVFKKIRRHNHRRKNGHRQPMTLLKITGINV